MWKEIDNEAHFCCCTAYRRAAVRIVVRAEYNAIIDGSKRSGTPGSVASGPASTATDFSTAGQSALRIALNTYDKNRAR